MRRPRLWTRSSLERILSSERETTRESSAELMDFIRRLACIEVPVVSCQLDFHNGSSNGSGNRESGSGVCFIESPAALKQTTIHSLLFSIGIIQASLRLGYWWGGRVADRRPQAQLLGRIILLASLATAAIALSKPFVLGFLQSHGAGLHLAAVWSALLLFAPPSVLLGMVAPFAVRLKLADTRSSGRTAHDQSGSGHGRHAGQPV